MCIVGLIDLGDGLLFCEIRRLLSTKEVNTDLFVVVVTGLWENKQEKGNRPANLLGRVFSSSSAPRAPFSPTHAVARLLRRCGKLWWRLLSSRSCWEQIWSCFGSVVVAVVLAFPAQRIRSQCPLGHECEMIVTSWSQPCREGAFGGIRWMQRDDPCVHPRTTTNQPTPASGPQQAPHRICARILAVLVPLARTAVVPFGSWAGSTDIVLVLIASQVTLRRFLLESSTQPVIRMPKRKRGKKAKVTSSSSTTLSLSTPSTLTGPVRFELLRQQKAFLSALPQNERDGFFDNNAVDPQRRAELWMDQSDRGTQLVDSHSWATPDPRAIQILRRFAPIVEVGCGANAYWCKTMATAGIDVVGYDTQLKEGGKIAKGGGKNTTKRKSGLDEKTNNNGRDNGGIGSHNAGGGFCAQRGGPEVLSTDGMEKRALFLCYVDEDVQVAQHVNATNDNDDDDDDGPPLSLGEACLEHYRGEYVIHVGELCGDTLSMEQAPWGRSSGPNLQQRLMAEYHCVLKASLTNWLHVRDTISVWKRSQTCQIVFAADDDEEEGNGNGEEEEEEVVEYKHIPVEERLPTDVAAPAFQDLLKLEPMNGKSNNIDNDNDYEKDGLGVIEDYDDDTGNEATKGPTTAATPTNSDTKEQHKRKKKKQRKKGKKAAGSSKEKKADKDDTVYEVPW